MDNTHLGTILIVDDDGGMRALLEALLDNAGISSLVAADADTALPLLQDNLGKVKGCLLDLNLENSRGEAVYDRLRELAPTLAVFPMSGILIDEIQERFEGRQIAGIITKPFRASQLIETIQAGLKRTSAR